jgi:hypothetical protein
MNEEKKLVWVMNLKDSVGMVGFMVNICCCQPQVKKNFFLILKQN